MHRSEYLMRYSDYDDLHPRHFFKGKLMKIYTFSMMKDSKFTFFQDMAVLDTKNALR